MNPGRVSTSSVLQRRLLFFRRPRPPRNCCYLNGFATVPTDHSRQGFDVRMCKHEAPIMGWERNFHFRIWHGLGTIVNVKCGVSW